MDFPTCRYFHYDAFRGREVMRCRLLEQSGQHTGWSLKLCQSCPVPAVLAESSCQHLLLEAEIGRRFGLFSRVQLFAACGAAHQPLADPKRCPTCEAKALNVER